MLLQLFTSFVLLQASAGNVTVCIRAGNVFNGVDFIGGRTITVVNGRIEAVEEGGAAVPDGAEVVDATDATVMPGLVDGHIHFMNAPKPYVTDIERHGAGRFAAEAQSAFPANRRHLLLNGVTAIIDVGAPPATYRGLHQSLERGKVVGPEVFFPGPLISAPGGHPAGTSYFGQHDLIGYGTVQVADTSDARAKVAAMSKDGADFVVVVYDRTPYRGREVPRLSLDVARAAVAEAHHLGLPVFAQVGCEQEAWDMIRAGADGIDHGFGAVSDSLLAEMASHGVFFTPTVCACAHRESTGAADMCRSLRRAHDLGVALVLGTDFPASCGENCGDDIFAEMRRFEAAGIERVAVLRAATSVPARKLRRQGALGVVTAGADADLVFFRGSADTGALSKDRVERVMLRGQTVVESGDVAAGSRRGFRRTSASVLGYPSWDPILSWLVIASASDVDLFDTGISAAVDLLASVRNMWAANLALDLPSPIPRTALRAGGRFDRLNLLFRGIGNSTKLTDTIEYSLFGFKEWLGGTTRISGPWRAQAGISFDQYSLKTHGGRSLPETLAGSQGGDEVIFSLGLLRDTRDHKVNPWSGHQIGVTVQAAPAILPGGHSFQKLTLDARGFVSVAKRHVLAGRLLCQQTIGDVPFLYMQEFGADVAGRGYAQHRFRDRVATIAQFDYRFPIWSFIGGVAFADFGQFQPSVDRFRLDGFHPSYGIGPRLILGANDGTAISADVGFTPEGWNLVLRGSHAF